MKAQKFAFPGWSSLLIAMVYLLICNQSAAETMPQSEKVQYAPSSSYKEITVTLPVEQYEKFNQLVAKLNPIVLAYEKLPKIAENAESLYTLDYELRRIVKQAGKSWEAIGFFEFKEIDVYNSEGLHYTGKLMTEADNLLRPQVSANMDTPQQIPPRQNTAELKTWLERIYGEYISLSMKLEDAEKLVLLDRQLYSVIAKVREDIPNGRPARFYDKKYSKLGLGIGSYSDQLEYSGQLILDAHRLNPFSRYREDTLFAYVYRDVHWFGGHPNLEELYAYLKEFPTSKYTLGIYSDLADFHHGLFMYLRYKPQPRDNYYEFRVECYEPYRTNQPIDAQILAAQKAGIDYYKKVISETHGRQRHIYADELISLELGENKERDHWCDGVL
jgi:hypothetical protein